MVVLGCRVASGASFQECGSAFRSSLQIVGHLECGGRFIEKVCNVEQQGRGGGWGVYSGLALGEILDRLFV